MNGLHNRKSIVNKEGLLLFGICLPFCYCFVCAMSETLHLLSVVFYYRIVNEPTTHFFIFWRNKFSILLQHIFNKICNLSNFLVCMHTVERRLSGRDFDEFLVYRIAHLNVARLLHKCQLRNKGSSGCITDGSIIVSTQRDNSVPNFSVCEVSRFSRWSC